MRGTGRADGADGEEVLRPPPLLASPAGVATAMRELVGAFGRLRADAVTCSHRAINASSKSQSSDRAASTRPRRLGLSRLGQPVDRLDERRRGVEPVAVAEFLPNEFVERCPNAGRTPRHGVRGVRHIHQFRVDTLVTSDQLDALVDGGRRDQSRRSIGPPTVDGHSGARLTLRTKARDSTRRPPSGTMIRERRRAICGRLTTPAIRAGRRRTGRPPARRGPSDSASW